MKIKLVSEVKICVSLCLIVDGSTRQADINCGTAGPAVLGQSSVARLNALESKINLGRVRPALQVMPSLTK